LKRFRERAKTRECAFSFEPFLPLPKELAEMHVGGITIDGKQFDSWRTGVDKDVGVTEKEKTELRKKYGVTNWYDRNCKVLGTKWDVRGHLDSESEKALCYGFESAWAPPVSGIRAVSRQYPELAFQLEFEQEEGGGGELEIRSGRIVSEREWAE
jgi:hypothetical protein